jgi:hypothetical protein
MNTMFGFVPASGEDEASAGAGQIASPAMKAIARACPRGPDAGFMISEKNSLMPAEESISGRIFRQSILRLV